MSSRASTFGFLSAVLSLAACASSGATAPSGARPEERLDEAVEENIARVTCSSANTTPAPTSGVIADFSAKQDGKSGGGDIPGKLISSVPRYAVPGATLTSRTQDGKLTIDVKAALGAKPQIFSTNLFFDRCVDASGFTGIEFSISGSLSGCSLTYASVDPEHQFYRSGGPYPPQTPISQDDVKSEPKKIVAPFRGSEIAGSPPTPTDPSKLAFIQWLVIAPVAADDGSAPPCAGTVIIDDVKLYR
jgi:hypothetical protein